MGAKFSEIDSIAQHIYGNQPVWDRVVLDTRLRPALDRFVREPTCFSCQSSVCCAQAFSVTLFEALPIAYMLLASGRTGDEKLVERMKIHRDAVRGRNLFDFFEDRHYCPFFDLDRRLCSVYAARPAVCRRVYVWGPESGCETLCGSERDEADRTIPTTSFLVHQLVAKGAYTLEKRLGLRADPGNPLLVGLSAGVLGWIEVFRLAAEISDEELTTQRIESCFSFLTEADREAEGGPTYYLARDGTIVGEPIAAGSGGEPRESVEGAGLSGDS